MLYFNILFFRELPNGSKFRKFGVGCQGQHTINLFASDTPCCFATSEKDVGSKPILQLHQCDNMQILFANRIPTKIPSIHLPLFDLEQMPSKQNGAKICRYLQSGITYF